MSWIFALNNNNKRPNAPADSGSTSSKRRRSRVDQTESSASAFDGDHNTERSMRDRHVSERSVNSTGGGANQRALQHNDDDDEYRPPGVPPEVRSRGDASISRTHSEERAAGIMRDEVSIHVEDEPTRPPATPAAAIARGIAAQCPICTEHYHLYVDLQRNSGEQDKAAEISGRKLQARSLLQQDTASNYQLIFNTEALFRGAVNDEMLFGVLLQMHKLLIENQLANEPDIQVVKWDLPMVRRHFHTRTGHVWDHMRLLQHELQRCDRSIDTLEQYDEVADRHNPGSNLPHVRAMAEKRQWQKQKLDVAGRIETALTRKAENWTAAAYALTSAINRLSGRLGNAALRDVHVAAGTATAGGDMLRSMNARETSTAVGSAHWQYGTSGY